MFGYLRFKCCVKCVFISNITLSVRFTSCGYNFSFGILVYKEIWRLNPAWAELCGRHIVCLLPEKGDIKCKAGRYC